MAPWQTNLLACPRNCYGPNRPPIESIHPPNSQQPATKQARRASTQTIQKRVFSSQFCVASSTGSGSAHCVPAARIAAIARTIRMPPRKTNWQLWAAGSPKKLHTIQPAWLASKHCPAQRGRRRSTAQLSVAGVEALPRRRISCESVVTAAARRAGAPPPRASSYHHDSCHDACHACLCWTWSHDTCPFSSLFSFSRAATRSSSGRISCSRLFFSVRSQRSIS